MAIEEFWSNLRSAVSSSSLMASVSPTEPAVIQDPKTVMMWLKPRSVAGFLVEEFDFLEQQQRSELQQNVERFLAVVDRVKKKSPTVEQIEEGRSVLGEMARLIEVHRYPDAETCRTQILIERELQGKLPKWVTGVSCETGTDHVGDPAVWITLDVTDEAVDKKQIARHGQRIEEEITSAYHQIGGRRWPFFRFRSPDAFARKGVSA